MSMMISLPVKCVQLSMMENHCGSYSVTLCMQRISKCENKGHHNAAGQRTRASQPASLEEEEKRREDIRICFSSEGKGCILYRFYFLTRDLNISIEIFKYELLQVKYLFLQSQETLK